MGWFRDAVSSVGSAIGSAVSTVATRAAQATTFVVSHAAEAVVDVAYNHTTRHLINAATGAELQDISVQRDIEVGMQGLTRGIASGAGALLDIPAGLGNAGVWVGNQFRADDNQMEYFQGPNMAGRFAEGVTWTHAQNERERAIMGAGQVAGEIAGFAAVTIATAGVGGAVVGGAIATTRGTAIGARAITTAQSAANWTRGAVNPINLNGRVNQAVTAAEAGFAVVRYNDLTDIDRQGQEGEQQAYEAAGGELADAVGSEQEMLMEKRNGLRDELGQMSERLADPSLSMAERQDILDRLDLVEEGLEIIIELDETTDLDARQEMLDRLEVIEPSVPADEDHSNLRSPLIRSPSGEEVRTAFASGVAAEGLEADRLTWDSPELERMFGTDVTDPDSLPQSAIRELA